jgi:hypothetical protein
VSELQEEGDEVVGKGTRGRLKRLLGPRNTGEILRLMSILSAAPRVYGSARQDRM